MRNIFIKVLIVLFCILVAIICTFFFYIIINKVNSPLARYIKCAKEKCREINIMMPVHNIFNEYCGIPVIHSELYTNLKKNKSVNVFTDSEEKKYIRKIKTKFLRRLFLKRMERNIQLACELTDIALYTSGSSPNFNFFGHKTKKYKILHDLYFVSEYSLFPVKNFNINKEKKRVFFGNKDIKSSLNYNVGAEQDIFYLNYQNMDGIFIISKTSKDDFNSFAPEFSYIPQYVISWPIFGEKIMNPAILDIAPELKYCNIDKLHKIQQNKKKYFLVSESKEYFEILEAIDKLSKKYNIDDLRLISFGRDGGGTYLKRILKENYILKRSKCEFQMKQAKMDKLADKYMIRFGNIDNDLKEELLKNSLSYINIAIYEGYGMPILEANAFGTPVIASNSGAITDNFTNSSYILKNKKGCKLLKYLTKPFLVEGICEIDKDDLFNVMEKIYLDENYRKKLGLKGYNDYQQKVKNGLSWEKLTDYMISVWKKDLNIQ